MLRRVGFTTEMVLENQCSENESYDQTRELHEEELQHFESE
jgi:hypothetical protein